MTKTECRKELEKLESEADDIIRNAIQKIIPCSNTVILAELFKIIRLTAVLRSEISLMLKEM